FTASFHFLSTWLQNDDQTLFGTADGKNFWDYVADEANFKSIFYEAMITDFELIASVLIEDCNEVSKGLKPLVDVGGSTGTMARDIATAFPDTKCTVFDLPLVVDNMVGTNNLDFFGGNMFEAIPPPNAVLLKWILHDWSDEESLKILKKCKESIPSTDEGGKVIIIDVAIENQTKGKETMETQLCFDMLMATFLKGKERSVYDWKKLFLAAGFSHYKITPNLGLWSLIEAYP
ncbi:trans-resveratrol di-O-methyltransferase, partial [Citrus clementina]|uniref:trans-resveratrol di-O-methyltransferase n=1 Tax=Citrus clementina TaxID=85681 RepID=UPI000CED73DF